MYVVNLNTVYKHGNFCELLHLLGIFNASKQTKSFSSNMKLSLIFTAVVCSDLRIDDVPTRMAKDVNGKFHPKTN